MSTTPDPSFSDAASSLGRSPSIDARDGALPRSESQRRSASKMGRKSGRSGNDLFVCFAPRTTLNLVNRPVVSPARDKGKEPGTARRNSRTLSSSIFSSKGPTKKQGFDVGEEPTSPKVTCIGQVRSKSKPDKKNKVSPSAMCNGVQQQSSIEERKKESACSSFAKDFSCFGMPCDSYSSLPSFRGDKKGNGTVFAKSLVLIQKDGDDKSMATADVLKTQSCAQSCSGEEIKYGDWPVKGKSTTPEEENHAEMSSIVTASPAPPVLVVPCTEVKSEALQTRNVEFADDQTSVEEDDRFEAEPPSANALLLMHSKVEHLRVVVPPPSINMTLKRSTSAPAHCRRESEEGNNCGQEDGGTDKKSAMEVWREMSRVLISSEDLPKPTTSMKSFLQRCKSLSRSLSRSSSEPAEEAQIQSPAQDPKNDASMVYEAQEALINEQKDVEIRLVNEVLSTRRSDSEALKVSLDVVPETWLWEACAVARQDPKEASGSGRRVEMKQIGRPTEWLDGELEAALWKSCQVAEVSVSHRRKDVGPTEHSQYILAEDADLTANPCLDAEVEATLWRCCSLVASHTTTAQDLQSEPKTDESGEVEVASKAADEEDLCGDSADLGNIDADSSSNMANLSRNITNLGRSSSVRTQGGEKLLERGLSLRRSASVGAGRQRGQEERGKIDKRRPTEQITEEKEESSHIVSSELAEAGQDMGDVKVAISKEGTGSYIVEAELWCAPSDNCASAEAAERKEDKCKQARTDAEDDAASIPLRSSILDRPAPPLSSPAPPATPPEAVLFLRYDLGAAFRISLDASVGKMEVSTDQLHQQQQKAMLEAISHLHIHDVQRTYTRLLKAASGKERASLSSAAIRLQRCKSEPVRLASY